MVRLCSTETVRAGNGNNPPAARSRAASYLGAPRPLIAVEAAWDCFWHVVETATWRNALACALAFLSRILPLPTDDITAHVLLTLCALNLGAVVGKLLDRRPNSARSSRRQVRNGHRATVPDSIPR